MVGAQVGQAAQTKLVRSLFMKGLEALVVEARSIATQLDTSGMTWQSIERNLGPTFADFANLLVMTDATHAARRSSEINDAVGFARSQGFEPVMAAAAGDALARLGALWSRIGADPPEADPESVLMRAVGAFLDGRPPVGVEAEPRR